MPFEPGEVVAGKYEVLDLIGLGGIGFVVSANHIELGEKVALKFLRPEALENAEAVARFAHEARASVQIKSEHVARVFDVGRRPDGTPFIVMEHLEGQDLGALLREQSLHARGPLPVEAAVEYVLQACEGLAAAHARGVIHRDIKPENLFLQRGHGVPMIKVLDFGISKVVPEGAEFDTSNPLVLTTMALGSPIYMSPEQLRASRDIDARTDIWSIGCVLFELLTGRHAFDAPSLAQVTARILEQESPALRSVLPSAPFGLEAIVKHCLAKDPLGRFQDVAELAVALYPYGPPRGRTSVERCCSLLRGAGLSQVDFQLPSVFPHRSSLGLQASQAEFGSYLPALEALASRTRPARPRLRWTLAAVAAGLGLGVCAAWRLSSPIGEPLPAAAASRPIATVAPAAVAQAAVAQAAAGAPLPVVPPLPEGVTPRTPFRGAALGTLTPARQGSSAEPGAGAASGGGATPASPHVAPASPRVEPVRPGPGSPIAPAIVRRAEPAPQNAVRAKPDALPQRTPPNNTSRSAALPNAASSSPNRIPTVPGPIAPQPTEPRKPHPAADGELGF